MSITVTQGQVWQDKDKRRNTRIEIIEVYENEDGTPRNAAGLVVGTEEVREYSIERLMKRWELISEKSIEVFTEPHAGNIVDVEVELTLNKDGSGSARVIRETPQPKFKTREQWLEAAVKELSKLFVKAGFEVPKVRVSVGWPGGRGKKAGVVGQCFASMSAEDNVAQIFVSPSVSDSLRVLATLTHEIVHAVDDCVNGHKGGFIKIAKEIGFLPAWTSSDNRTDELTEKLQKILDKLGPFPHAAIKTEERPVVQKTYMLKVLCTEDPDYFVRMTAGKIEEYGTPLCPCHELAMEVEEK